MRLGRWLVPLALVLSLCSAPAASAATCSARANGSWTMPSTWSCGTPGALPSAADAVVIPAGRTVSVNDGATVAAGPLTLSGALELGDQSEVDASDLTTGGGRISGPQYAMLVVTVASGDTAVVDAAGLTIDGAYLNVTGAGVLAIAGPLALSDGGWVESNVDATWTGTAPWRVGGSPASPSSGFQVFGAQLTISGATAAQLTSGGGDGVLQLDGGATLLKADATTSRLDLAVLIDGAEVRVGAGTLSGRFQGAGALAVEPGATLALAGTDIQVAPPAIDMAGGTLEVEAGANLALVLPGAPLLRRLALAAGASADIGIEDGSAGPVTSEVDPPDALADEIAIAAGATLAVAGGGGTLALADRDVLSGAGTLDASLENGAGTVAPSGALQVTGDYSQGAGGTLALDLRSADDGDRLRVDGRAVLAGALEVHTRYAPAAAAAPLVLSAAAKPAGAFAKTTAPVGTGHAWTPSTTAAGVVLALTASGGATVPAGGLARPQLAPAIPVVGGRTRCVTADPKAVTYQWLRAGKPVVGATKARYRVTAADAGRALACRVTATAAGHATATSKRARARLGLRIGTPRAASRGGVTVRIRCSGAERRCTGTLRVLVAGRQVAGGRFALRAPGGVVRLAGAEQLAGVVVVRASYRNGKGAARELTRRLALPV